jgi:hypothetical protein
MRWLASESTFMVMTHSPECSPDMLSHPPRCVLADCMGSTRLQERMESYGAPLPPLPSVRETHECLGPHPLPQPIVVMCLTSADNPRHRLWRGRRARRRARTGALHRRCPARAPIAAVSGVCACMDG